MSKSRCIYQIVIATAHLLLDSTVAIYTFHKNLIRHFSCCICCLKFCHLLRMTSPIVFIFVSIAVLDICYGSLNNSSEYGTNCNVNGSRIECEFFVSTNWSFLEFRTWLDEIKGNVTEVNLRLECLDGGSIFLPLPYRARKLRSISVKNCIIDGQMSERHDISSRYPDTLLEQKLENAIIREDLKQFIERVYIPYDRSSVCGQESLVYIVSRNVSREFVLSKNISPEEVMMHAAVHQENKEMNNNITCMFKHLESVEESHLTSLSSSFFNETFTDTKKYPKLSTLKLYSIGIQELPQQLKRWSQYLPSLKRLDLSSNALTSFSFEHPKTNQSFLVIDLTKNHITSVPEDLPMYLNREPDIYVKLENNPIHCDCKIRPLSTYFKIIRKMQYPRRYEFYQNIISVKCQSPSEKKGQRVLDLDLSHC